MNNYSITAIMPTCGRTKCIGESIFSFLNQTYQNKKLIILDTHPQDMKFDISLPSNVIYIKEDSHKFSNLGGKFKQLIGMVDTDLFCIWEDDDLWLPNHMENLAILYHENKYLSPNKPLSMAHINHFSILGGVEKPVYKVEISSNVCWCRYLFENKNVNADVLPEPFDVAFLGLFHPVWMDKNISPTYLYRWDNGQCHMSGLYGQKPYDELYRMFEDGLSKIDISNEKISIMWRHDYLSLCERI
jgi:hypothetical protein